jgi:hypothetical protein
VTNPLTSGKTKNLTYKEYIKTKYKNLIILAHEMEKTLGTEKTHSIIKEAFYQEMYKSVTEEMKELGPVEKFTDFIRIEKEDNERPSVTSTVTIAYERETDTELELHVTKCLEAEVFRELEAADLGYLIVCNPDHAYAKACNPRVKLRRSKTLMRGDPYCNHIWYWE